MANTLTYLRSGRIVRASGVILHSREDGTTKVKPTRAGWGAIYVTPTEIEAGKIKPAIPPRIESPASEAKPKRITKAKPAPLPRWKQLVERVRLYEVDHHPKGWPAVEMAFLTELADELEAAQSLFQKP